MDEKEKYIGSVRFFKHLILSAVGAAVAIPVCLCVMLAVSNERLAKENRSQALKNQETEEKLQEILDERSEAEAVDLYGNSPKTALGEEEQEDWKLILVNEQNPLDKGFQVKLKTVTGSQKVDERILDPLNEMMADMREEGLRPVVCSGYRTIEKQSNLFNEYIEEKLKAGWNYTDAFYKAKGRIALPGTSEHHTGLAVDIVGMSHQSLDDSQADTKEAKWLAEHCAEYGFILRYLKDKTEITGIEYESWHFRYVGEEAAAYIMEHEITLEEFLESVDK